MVEIYYIGDKRSALDGNIRENTQPLITSFDVDSEISIGFLLDDYLNQLPSDTLCPLPSLRSEDGKNGDYNLIIYTKPQPNFFFDSNDAEIFARGKLIFLDNLLEVRCSLSSKKDYKSISKPGRLLDHGKNLANEISNYFRENGISYSQKNPKKDILPIQFELLFD